VLGVAGNRINVFLVAYSPPYATHRYVPSVGEVAVTVGLIAALVLLYRVLVTVLPVLPTEEDPPTSHGTEPRRGVRVATSWGRW
jgi:Ni/Fe-hydrogenase subunit HybB-like protein